ncbi:hypothetical protein [Belnapia moabensis]|jgi:hypothetical protein|uniref:hypothetical protein n=1 Tax=Belnapia moabensis TaxID=365533 RepID=UPI0005BE1DC6|nr:hypothetical protein [Belnapia moabensis]
MKSIVTLFALLLMLGFAGQMGMLEPARNWLVKHHKEAALTEEQAQAALAPEVFTIDSLFATFSQLPAPWAAIAKGGFILLCVMLALSIIAAITRMVLGILRWFRDVFV